MTLRIAVITDAHHGTEDAPPKLCSAALPLLTQALSALKNEQLSYFVDLGDRIDDRSVDLDIQRATEFANAMRPFSTPRSYIMGNHDSYFLTPDEWSGLLDAPVCSHARDVENHRLVFFSPNVNNERGKYQYRLAPSDLAWLREQLATDLPCIVFSHVPLLAGRLQGNYYFEGTEGRAEFLNSSEARDIVAQSNTILVVSGHVHWNTWHCVDGVHYVTVQSLTESFTTSPDPAAAFTLIEVGSDITVDVRGRDRKHLKLPRRQIGQRWLRP